MLASEFMISCMKEENNKDHNTAYYYLSSSNNELIFVRDEYYLEIRAVRTGKKVFSRNIGKMIRHPTLNSTGREIMFIESSGIFDNKRTLTILDRRTEKEIFSKKFDGSIRSMCFNPFGEEIMLIENQRRLIILNQKTGEEVFSKKFEEIIFSPCFNFSDKSIESISLKKGDEMIIIDKETGKEKKQSLFKLIRGEMGI